MIHSQDVNILDKNYNLFSSAKGLPFNFVLTFLTVSTIKRMVRLKYPIILISKLDSGLWVCPDNIFSYKNIF